MCKNKCSFCKFISRNYKTIYGILLWILLLVFLLCNFSRIMSEPIFLDYIAIALFIILTFMPLLSEMSLMGISIKKELSNTKNEIKNELLVVREQMINLNISNNNKTDLHIYQSSPPPENVDAAIEASREYKKEHRVDETFADTTSSIPKANVTLFKARLSIEKKFNKIYELLSITPKRYIFDVNLIIDNIRIASIIEKEKLSIDHLIKIKQVINICNRGIHGELVDSKYVVFVNELLPIILYTLDKLIQSLSNEYIVVCPKCKYIGPSNYQYVCPKCNFVSDDS